MNTKYFIAFASFTVIAILITVVVLGLARPETPIHTNSHGEAHELVAYKSATCGCCGNWVSYMRTNGYKVEVVNTEDVDSVKQKYDVPEELYSCHTTIINDGEYFVEGHIPEESVSKLLEETPTISGIGMPGMPSGSPGMPGAQTMPFEIMQVGDNQKLSVFEVI